MITGFFLQIGLSVMSFIVGLLPFIAFPTQISTAIATIGGYMNAWTYIFPVATLLQVLGVAFIFHGLIAAWHYLHLLARYIRGR